MNRAARFKADLFRIQLEIESLRDPILVGVHFQPRGGRLHGAEEVQVQYPTDRAAYNLGLGVMVCEA